MFTMKALFNDITHRIQGGFSDSGPGPVTSEDLNKYLAQWNGWVEISNVNYEPRFQGKIVSSGKSIGWDGLLLAGILLEKNAPPGLLEAIDEQKPKKLLNGGVVVKCLTSHDRAVIMRKLEDQETMDRIAPYVKDPEKIVPQLVINSEYITHMDCKEAVAEFDAVWEGAMAETAKVNIEANRPDKEIHLS